MTEALHAPRVSVVIPVLDEAQALPGALDHLAGLAGRWEPIVVDGGSADGTVRLAEAHPSRPLVVRTARGRAVQMNAGVGLATGELLLFLHADTLLPHDAHAQLCSAIGRGAQGGNFRLRFGGGDRFSRLLTRWYGIQRRAGIYYGDSVIWLRSDLFARLGGFAELPIMEDYDLVRRLERCVRTTCLPGPVVTSGRRGERLGLARTVASWTVIRWLFVAGAPPARLAELYPHVR